MKCICCPVEGMACAVETDPRLSHLCAMAAKGVASDLIHIKAMSARSGDATSKPEPKRPVVAKVPLALSIAAAKHGFRNCPESSLPACGCSNLVACSRLGRDANIRDCVACPRITGLT